MIPDLIKKQVWNLLRPYKDVRLRARDIPGVPFYIKPIIANWTMKVGHGAEWLLGPDTGA